MKILILNYEYPPIGGGCGVVSKYHAEGLSSLGHQVTVLTTWFTGEKEEEKQNYLTVLKLKSKRRYIHKSTFTEWLSWIRKAKQFLKQHLQDQHYDLCIAHFALPGGEVARFVNQKFGLPYIVVSHGQDIPWFFPRQMFKYHILTYFWIKSIIKKAEVLVLLSKEMEANAIRFLGKKLAGKNMLIPNGCDMQIYKPDESKKSSTFIILFIGRLVEQKDPITFLKAIKELSKTSIPFEVHIFGNGPMLETMKTFCQKANLKNISFKGWVTKPEIIMALQSASLQVVSSKDEAMSIAVLESLSCGQYIISTPVSGNTELIVKEDNGDFFPFSDYMELSNKIENFYHQKFIGHFKVNSEFLKEFRGKYSWKNILIKYEQIMNEVITKYK